MTEDAHDKQVGDEARLLYSTAVAEIAGFKQQQWQVANYALLAYAAVASVPRLVTARLSQIEYAVLGVLALAVLIAGWVVVGMFADSIRLRRERLTHIRKNRFTEEFRNSWRIGKSAEEVPDRPEDKTSLLLFFRAVLSVGFGLTVWLLVRSYCVA